jgi:hypothetical protein
MKNKKSQVIMAILIFLLLLVLIGFWFHDSNPYNTFKTDCRKAYGDKFLYNSTCFNFDFTNGNGTEHPCQLVNYTELNKFCLDKYSNEDGK